MDKFFRAVKKIHRESVKANNRAERERKRQERANNVYYAALQREESIQDVADEVARWNKYVKEIQSLHKSCSPPINWDDIEAQKEPEIVSLGTDHTQRAKEELEAYKPTLFHKLFNQVHKNKAKLKAAIQLAKNQDAEDFEEAQVAYDKTYKAWKKLNNLAKGIKNGNSQSYLDVVQYFNFLSEINNLGTKVELNIFEDFIDIDLFVNDEEIIPKYVLSQTKTGKLSKKNMTKTMYYELYQDYVCSAVLRVAREFFAHLPIDKLRINALLKMVNSQTGHLEDNMILSVIIPLETLKTLKFKLIDPSDSMQNFVYTMNFRKTQGFRAVDKAELVNIKSIEKGI